jgi:bifunctional DNA-binding transcriptional regulator/antitoxin component of YhaV-PrlF toxin-antitoxin module
VRLDKESILAIVRTMARVTSKLQVTVPKALAVRYHIEPGDEIEWQAAGDAIRVVPAGRGPRRDVATRLELFDRATARQRERARGERAPAEGRGWMREELYDRGRSR